MAAAVKKGLYTYGPKILIGLVIFIIIIVIIVLATSSADDPTTAMATLMTTVTTRIESDMVTEGIQTARNRGNDLWGVGYAPVEGKGIMGNIFSPNVGQVTNLVEIPPMKGIDMINELAEDSRARHFETEQAYTREYNLEEGVASIGPSMGYLPPAPTHAPPM